MPIHTLSRDTVNKWLNNNYEVSSIHRKAFFLFVRTICDEHVYKQWKSAFELCWARAAMEDHRKLFPNHAKWIQSRYNRNIMDEPYTLKDVYVPISTLEFPNDGDNVKVFSEDDLINFALHGFEGDDQKSEKRIRWCFIHGGPGSGKSALAITLAHKLITGSAREYVVFARGAQVASAMPEPDPKNDIVTDNIFPTYFIEKFIRSNKKRLTIILDGLDEIGASAHKSTGDTVYNILMRIRDSIREAEEQGKTVRVIALGRDTITQHIKRAFPEKEKLLAMGSLSGVANEGKYAEEYGDDLRPLWWERYAKAKGVDKITTIPKYLSDSEHSLYSLSREPLLSYLLARSAWLRNEETASNCEALVEYIDAHTLQKNRNEVYADIVNYIKDGEWNEEKKHGLPQGDFINILQHIALATWQNGTGRTTTLQGITEAIQDEKTRKDFKKLEHIISEDTDPTLTTIFYYRFESVNEHVDGIPDLSKYEIEFTHKSFSEYLLATFLFNQFKIVLEAMEPHIKTVA